MFYFLCFYLFVYYDDGNFADEYYDMLLMLLIMMNIMLICYDVDNVAANEDDCVY
jgi:hypothetical protein